MSKKFRVAIKVSIKALIILANWPRERQDWGGNLECTFYTTPFANISCFALVLLLSTLQSRDFLSFFFGELLYVINSAFKKLCLKKYELTRL